MSGRVALFVARKVVIRDLIPGRPRRYEGVELRPDPGLAVERAEADRDFFALRPLRTEQTRSADGAEGFHASAVRPEDANQLLTGEQAESFARNSSLRSAEGARVLPAPRAVAVIGPPKRAVTSNRTPPQRQEPWSGFSGLGAAAMALIGAESDVTRLAAAFCPCDPCYLPSRADLKRLGVAIGEPHFASLRNDGKRCGGKKKGGSENPEGVLDTEPNGGGRRSSPRARC
jgi:hypothetical protein